MAFIYAKLFKGYETHHKNREMKAAIIILSVVVVECGVK